MRELMMTGLLFALACNPPEAKDNATAFFSLEPVAPEGFARAIAITASVDAQARDLETELEVTLSGLFDDASTPSIDMGVLVGLQSAGSGSYVVGETLAIGIPADFGACEGLTATVREDGGCDYGAAALVTGDGAYPLILGISLRVQADDSWTGDKDDLSVAVAYEVSE